MSDHRLVRANPTCCECGGLKFDGWLLCDTCHKREAVPYSIFYSRAVEDKLRAFEDWLRERALRGPIPT